MKNRQLVLPGGTTYRVLVLPEMETMTPVLLRQIRDLVKAGATVVGPKPRKSPSLSDYPECDAQVQHLAAELWGTGKTAERRVGKGRVLVAPPAVPAATDDPPAFPDLYCHYDVVAGVLAGMSVPPDFESDASVRYAHRRDGRTDIYFVANPQERRILASCSFRVAGRRPEVWDPMTGDRRAVRKFEEEDKRTRMELPLEAGGSAFVIFREPKRGRETGIAAVHNSESQAPIEIRGPWELCFPPGLGAPEKIVVEGLADWSKHPDPGVKYFSGQATYRTTFSLDARLGVPGARLMLDLGRVQVMARVLLNGKDLGVLWKAPFQVEVTDAAKTGVNTLEIAVANLWPNRLIGDQSLPPEKRVAWTTWNPFKKDTPLLESGLLGPVTIRELEE